MRLFSTTETSTPSAQSPTIATPITRQEKKQGYLSEFTSPLLHFTPDQPYTLEQSFEGIQVFGGTGSGKTSGSGKHIASAMLYAGYGGLVLCAKPQEAKEWVELAAKCGRSDSVIRFGEDTPMRFNFIQYELAKGASPYDVVDVIENAGKATNSAKTMSGGSQGQEFWNEAARDLLVASLFILYGSSGNCELEKLAELVAHAPRSLQQAEDDDWQNNSIYFRRVVAAEREARKGNNVSTRDLSTARNYFLHQFAPMSEKMRTSVIQTLMTMLNRFGYGTLSELFTTRTNVVPEMTHEGAILIIDLPVMGSADNRIAAQIWKYAWQRATQSRATDSKTRPVFLWADESQYFLSDKDVEFQSTARSARVTTVYMTQTMTAYKHAIGGTEQASTASRAFIANLRTQIFHSNNDGETNNYAADLIGKALVWRRSINRSEGESRGTNRSWSDAISEAMSQGTSWNEGENESHSRSKGRGHGSTSQGFFPSGRNKSQNTNRQDSSGITRGRGGTDSRTQTGSQSSGGGDNHSETYNEGQGAQEQKDYLVPPEDFNNTLRTGGTGNKLKVDAIVVSPSFSEPYKRVTYDQRTV